MKSAKASKGKKAFNLVKVVLVLLISLAVAAILIKTRTHPQREEVTYEGPLVEVVEARRTSQNMVIRTYGTVRSGEDLSSSVVTWRRNSSSFDFFDPKDYSFKEAAHCDHPTYDVGPFLLVARE